MRRGLFEHRSGQVLRLAALLGGAGLEVLCQLRLGHPRELELDTAGGPIQSWKLKVGQTAKIAVPEASVP